MTTTLKLEYDPAYLVGAVIELLREQGVPVADKDDIPSNERAFLGASSLLLALGVEPVIDANDHTQAAELIRGLLLEGKTRTTTRSRRSL